MSGTSPPCESGERFVSQMTAGAPSAQAPPTLKTHRLIFSRFDMAAGNTSTFHCVFVHDSPKEMHSSILQIHSKTHGLKITKLFLFIWCIKNNGYKKPHPFHLNAYVRTLYNHFSHAYIQIRIKKITSYKAQRKALRVRLPGHDREMLAKHFALVRSPTMAFGPRVLWSSRHTPAIKQNSSNKLTVIPLIVKHPIMDNNRLRLLLKYEQASDYDSTEQ